LSSQRGHLESALGTCQKKQLVQGGQKKKKKNDGIIGEKWVCASTKKMPQKANASDASTGKERPDYWRGWEVWGGRGERGKEKPWDVNFPSIEKGSVGGEAP